MISRAVLKYARISAKKAGIVADAVRGKIVEEAVMKLTSINKKASPMVCEVIRSAFSNAKVKNPESNFMENNMFISKITIDKGPMMKRYRAASMGRASSIKKRSCHITVELDAIPEKNKEMDAAKQKALKKQPEKKVQAKQAEIKNKPKKLAARGSK